MLRSILFSLLLLPTLAQAVTLETATPKQILAHTLGADDVKLLRLEKAFGDYLQTVVTVKDTVWDISPKTDSLGVTTLDSVVSHVNITTIPRSATLFEIYEYFQTIAKKIVVDYETKIQEAKADSVAKTVADSIKAANQPTF